MATVTAECFQHLTDHETPLFFFLFPDSLFPSLCVCYLTHQQTIEGGGGGGWGGKKFPLPSYVCMSNGRGGVSRRANGLGWLYRRRRQSAHFSDPVPFSIRSRRRLCIYQSLENLCVPTHFGFMSYLRHFVFFKCKMCCNE